MTALHQTPGPALPEAIRQPASRSGFGGLLRKELTEWRRSRRAPIVLAITSGFMALLSINSWLRARVPMPDDAGPGPAPVLDPLPNLVAAASAQIFVLATIFAVMNVLLAERESGTLAWTASKPVSRSMIWLAKLVSSTAALCLVAGAIPLAATTALIAALYGPPPVDAVIVIAAGMGMSIALYVAVCLAASTVVTSPAAVAAIGLGVTFVPELIGSVVPIAAYLPTSILPWSLATAAGQPMGFVTIVTWTVTVTVLITFSTRRMEAIEL